MRRAGITIGTGMKAASVGIEAPAKGKIRAFVATEDGLGCFLKNVGGDG
jgi:hypothetical protein